VDPMAEKFSMVSPYNYALNSPLKVIDPNSMEALPLDGQMTFSGYLGDDGLGNYSGSRKGDKPKKDEKNIIPSMKTKYPHYALVIGMYFIPFQIQL
jgi:hypothetical protein